MPYKQKALFAKEQGLDYLTSVAQLSAALIGGPEALRPTLTSSLPRYRCF